jgi:hypothetical protein
LVLCGWKEGEEEMNNDLISRSALLAKRIGKADGKPVRQYDKSGQLVMEYASIMEAQRQTGISQGSIGDCLHERRKTAGGYTWKYAK